MINKELGQKCVNTIRVLSMDAVQAAKSGHPGMPMGMADVAFVLWSEFLKHNPSNPEWFDRDRFILSAGHGSMLLYSLLHLFGYDLSLDELKNFRQLGSKTPGHPEVGLTPGVETTTGPLGQGFSTGVGMAVAEQFLASKFNRDGYPVSDHCTYAIVSDGDLMEGVSHEAASLAGHLKLGKLIYLYDSNRITIDGSTDLSYSEDTGKRFEAYGWHVQQIDGHDHDAIRKAIQAARESEKPSLIECKTVIGFGSPNKEGTADSHGAPLGDEEIRLTKERLGMNPDLTFEVPAEVVEELGKAVQKGEQMQRQWDSMMKEYSRIYPNDAVLFRQFVSRKLPGDWSEILPEFDADPKGMATRKASGTVLNQLSKHIHNLIGGSADLTGSNNTDFEDSGIFRSGERDGRYIHYGVREHAMAAAMNGMALHTGVIPYGGTFLVFADYNKPSVRIAALSKIPSIFVFSHDSIGLGEDGPTHQPIEHLASMRATPNVWVFRPADANETAYCWKAAIERDNGPSLLALTRQSLPVLDRALYGDAAGTEKGGYVIKMESGEEADLIMIATGSEVHLSIEAAELLENEGYSVRVVSMPCVELFEQQDLQYREAVLPVSVKKRISAEAATTFGWHKWVGEQGIALGIDQFGISAPYEQVYDYFGLTGEKIAQKGRDLLS
ncbi:MAG: transketolase [Balneolaceae bacterium]|nr:MAG: transketolase [Balneolaceae bacterium]